MNTKRLFIILPLVASVLATFAHAGDIDMDDETNAKLARLKARERAMAQASGQAGAQGQNGIGECGSLNVGNVINEKGVKAPREVTVVISGDVINMGNKCR